MQAFAALSAASRFAVGDETAEDKTERIEQTERRLSWPAHDHSSCPQMARTAISRIAQRGSSARDPKNGEIASELFEIVVGSDESGLMDRRERGCKAVYVGDMMERSQFRSLQCLSGFNR